MDRKRNIDKLFWRYSSKAHFPPALQNSANLMPRTWFYSNLKFSAEIFFFLFIHIITFTSLNVNNLQSPGNRN